MVTTKDVRKPYFAVKKPTPVTDELLNRLLGLAVVDFGDPLGKNYRPDRPLKPRDAIDHLYPERHAEMKDFEKVMKRVDMASAKVAVQTVAEACLSAMRERGSTLTAPHLRRIDMDNAGKRIDDLLRTRPPLLEDDGHLVEPGLGSIQSPALVPANQEAGQPEAATGVVVPKEAAGGETGAIQSLQLWQSWLLLLLSWATSFLTIVRTPRPNAEPNKNRSDWSIRGRFYSCCNRMEEWELSIVSSPPVT